MELKKSPKADLQNKKSIFLLIGLVITLAVMIGLFNWSQSEVEIEIIEENTEVVEQEVVEITRQEEPPKTEAPKVAAPVVSDILEVMDNKITVQSDLSAFNTEFSEETAVVEIQPLATREEETLLAEDQPVIKVEKMPQFEGGDVNAFREWVLKNIVYPPEAEQNNITGRVVVRFIVERDGSPSQIEVLTSPDKSLSDEAIRVISKSPKWTPGEQRGKKVRVIIIVPIDFRI